MEVKRFDASAQAACYDAKSVDAGFFANSYYRGNYLLKSGCVSTCTVYNMESGIFADEHLYLPLKVMTKQLFRPQEAKLYLESIGKGMPSLYQVMRIKLAVNEINESLKLVGMGSYALPEDVLNGVWYKEALDEASPTDVRRCIVVSHRGEYTEPVCKPLGKNLLSFNDSLLYRRTADSFVPVRMFLVFSLGGVDFLSAAAEDTVYDFYRGKDLKTVFLGENSIIRAYGSELIEVEQPGASRDDLYQIINGGLARMDSYRSSEDDVAHISQDGGKVTVMVSHRDPSLFEGGWAETFTYKKGRNGLYTRE